MSSGVVITVEISHVDIYDGTNLTQLNFFKLWLCAQLKEAGVPIVGGPLLPKVDTTKGVLTTWTDDRLGKNIYQWEPKAPEGGPNANPESQQGLRP